MKALNKELSKGVAEGDVLALIGIKKMILNQPHDEDDYTREE